MAHFGSDSAPIDVSDSELSWIASAYFAAEIVMAFVGCIFSHKIGRKYFLICASFLLSFAWFLKIFASSVEIFILCRLMMGAAAGVFDITWTVYVGEVSSPTIRGIFGSLLISSFTSGVMLEFLLSLYVSHVYLSVVPFALSVPAFILMFFVVEAPQFLIMNDKYEEAGRSLAWLRGFDEVESVQAEFDELKHHLEEEKRSERNIKHFMQHPFQYKTTIVGILIFTLAQPSGNIGILSFETIILNLFNFPLAGSQTFIYGALQFIFVNANPFLIESVGRRQLLIFGFGTLAFMQGIIAALFYVYERTPLTIPYIAYVVACLFNIYGVIFVACVFPTVYVLKSELFPQELKGIASCFSTATNAFADFIVVKLFVWIWSGYGLYVNFILYSLICLVSVAYVYTLIPETKGKSLIEIQQNIKKDSVP